MELTKQVCSLDLAKRLKELGVKQESLFWWIQQVTDGQSNNGKMSIKPTNSWIVLDRVGQAENVSAFTVAELGEMLPESFQCWKWTRDRTLRQEGGEVVWNCLTDESTTDGRGDVIVASTEADAHAKMLIYLLENKLLAANN